MAEKITEQESQQLLQSIQMFEGIVEADPNDCQSLETLKEAYARLGRKQDSLKASKRLAKAYVSVGQISQAVLEYEGIAQEFPGDAEVKTALAELETRTRTDVVLPAASPTQRGPVRAKPEDGDVALANALLMEKIVTTQAVEPLLGKLKELRKNEEDRVHPLSLATLLVKEQIAKADDLVSVMVDRSRLPYIPLSSYDVDREVAFLVPQDVAWKHCLIPFDLISSSVMIATANPFDQVARKMIESMVEYHVFWYVASPEEITAAIRRAHGLDRQKTGAKP